MMAKTLLEDRKEDEPLTEREIRDYMSGNLCRCNGYQQIVDAIGQAYALTHGSAEKRV